MSRNSLRLKALENDACYFQVEASALVRIVDEMVEDDPDLAVGIEVFLVTQKASVFDFLAQVVIGKHSGLAVCQRILVEITFLLVVRRVGSAPRMVERAIKEEIARGVRETRQQFEALEKSLAGTMPEPDRQVSCRRPYGAELVVRLVEAALQRVLSSVG